MYKHICGFFFFLQGGRRSERKKWNCLWEESRCVVYVVDLACYDRILYEENDANGMVDQYNLWRDLCSCQAWEEKKDLVYCLIFNKADLLERKVEQDHIPITTCSLFRSYSGRLDHFYSCLDHICDTFLQCAQEKNKRVLSFVISALDSKQIACTFRIIRKHTEDVFRETVCLEILYVNLLLLDIMACILIQIFCFTNNFFFGK
ncbi:G-protein subunit alpha 2 [Reticulomyxa filosa]|uniref:G-protein subunit alpha 2 n=1 Tax=Reticulomyxa filosa TaxID=46433 RepID=X6P9C4_RETFI|nr:G-protein subunit alpha 2 [Reticulomyxa filosa]|eukprot:ETO34237.1 G-protein subunit alpha 2 [Reticulomyxa filosa]